MRSRPVIISSNPARNIKTSTSYSPGSHKASGASREQTPSRNFQAAFSTFLQLGESYPSKKTLTLLNEYATRAEEDGNLEDAFHMFSFMALLYPCNYVLYLKVCELCEQLHGIEAAVQLYEMTSRLFEEPNVLFLTAECEARCGHWEQAKIYVTQALKIFEQRPPSTPQEMEFKADLKELLELVEKACE